ncbi:MAG TPA: hypothetical protein VKB93_10200 [Thermoanaerobaculia bacterium]|nr:hypothetical protein [Thermoanaerobaculia bacterium]
MNSKRKWIWFLGTIAVVAVAIYFGSGALWTLFLKMHGVSGH